MTENPSSPESGFPHAVSLYRLPTLPQAADRLLFLLETPQWKPSDIVDVVLIEPVMMLHLLRITTVVETNGAAVTRHLMDTASRLGKDGLRMLAYGAVASQPDCMFSLDFQDRYRRYWRHAVTTAALARHLAERIPNEDADTAYICGLLREIGQIPLMVRHHTRSGATTPQKNDENRIHGASACGDRMLTGDFPLSAVKEVGRFRFYPLDAQRNALPLVKIVSLADVLAFQMVAGASPNTSLACEFLGISQLKIDGVLHAAIAEICNIHDKLDLPMEAPDIPVTGDRTCGFPARLNHRLVGQMATNTASEAFANAEGTADVIDRLAWAMAVRYGSCPCVVMRPDADGGFLTQIRKVPDAHSDSPGLRIRIGGTAAAAAFRECRPKVMFPDTSDATATDEDRRITELLNTQGYIAIPMGTQNSPAGVVIGGLDAAKTIDGNDTIAALCRLVAAAKLDGAVDHPPGGSFAHARLLSYAMDRLLFTKTARGIATPLNIVKNYLNVLRLKLPEAHFAQKEISVIDDELHRIDSMISQLILPTESSQLEWFPVNSLIDNLVAVCRASLQSPVKIDLITEFEDTLPEILGNRDGIAQILLCLLHCTAETLTDGGQILIRTQSGRPASQGTSADKIHIIVKDDGRGIGEADRVVLSQPFVGVEAAIASGRGLSVIRAAVSVLGGTMVCESTPGKGTTATLTLPARPERVIPPLPPTTPPSPAGAN